MYGNSGTVLCVPNPSVPTLSWVPLGIQCFTPVPLVVLWDLSSPLLSGVHVLASARSSMEEVSTAVPYGKPSCG